MLRFIRTATRSRRSHCRALDDSGVDLSCQPLPVRVRSRPDTVFHQNFAVRERHLWMTLDLLAVEYRMIGTLMEILVSNSSADFWIEQNQIGIAADIDRSFARVETKDHRRRCRQYIHELLHSHAPFDHHLIVHNGES